MEFYSPSRLTSDDPVEDVTASIVREAAFADGTVLDNRYLALATLIDPRLAIAVSSFELPSEESLRRALTGGSPFPSSPSSVDALSTQPGQDRNSIGCNIEIRPTRFFKITAKVEDCLARAKLLDRSNPIPVLATLLRCALQDPLVEEALRDAGVDLAQLLDWADRQCT